jgi:hypothetical protein
MLWVINEQYKTPLTRFFKPYLLKITLVEAELKVAFNLITSLFSKQINKVGFSGCVFY